VSRRHSPRLAARFAVSILIAFAGVGFVLSVVVSRQLRDRQEAAANYHTVFVTDSILRYIVQPADLTAPLDTNGVRYRELLGLIQRRVLLGPVVRVKIWSPDGTVLFSDEPRLVGRIFEDEVHELSEVLEGHIESGVSDLDAEENEFERPKFSKLYQTYVPLRLGERSAGSHPVAVAELYTDYAGIASQVDKLFRTLLVTLLAGLSALYALMLPISRRVARTMSSQNVQLETQAGQLRDLLAKEQRTVAELRDLNRLKDEFVAVASHEVRTPLTAIVGYAKTLRQPQVAVDEGTRDEFLEGIERQADRLTRLVENLLASSNIEDEQRHLSLGPVSFAEACTEAVATLGQRGGRIRVDVPPDLPPVITNQQRMELILSNLLDNALKFSPNGTLCELAARHEGDSLVFWVKDRGMGIPAEELQAIFERFRQVDSSRTRQFGGVGLGLSLVRELVTSLGGSIQVTSQPGQGSMFTVTLPLQHPLGANGSSPADARVGATPSAQ
jgi:signal transduction histidine kinase